MTVISLEGGAAAGQMWLAVLAQRLLDKVPWWRVLVRHRARAGARRRAAPRAGDLTHRWVGRGVAAHVGDC